MRISNPLRRAASTVSGALKKLTHRDVADEPAIPGTIEARHSSSRNTETPHARPARREPDIGLDRIENAYIPTQTSLKAPFRASGDDRQRDQEFSRNDRNDRWNDEDRFTNKSGDPRIGTHGRSYEPGEARVASPRRTDFENE